MRKALCVLVCVLAAACGGGDSPTAPTPPQPFNQTVTGTLNSFGYGHHPLTVPRAGNMTLNLSWPSSADLDLYLTTSACQEIYPMGNCQFLAVSDRAGAGAESITRTVAAGETFKIWVDNFAFNPQNYTLTINIQ